MKKRYFHFFCERCEEKSNKLPSSDLTFLSKHVDRNCPSEGFKVIYEDGTKLKVIHGDNYEYNREMELKNYLSRIRRILKDFVNMPNWDYGRDVDNIIEETIKLRVKIVEDVKRLEEENKDLGEESQEDLKAS